MCQQRFQNLTNAEMLSGYAEMLKHAMLSSREMTDRLLRYDITGYEPESLLRLLEESVSVKCGFVSLDFNERGLRKALNFGHTFAHAFESLAMVRKAPLSHGYAVAFGMVAALVVSRMKLGFPSDDLQRYAAYVAENYGAFEITCDDYPRLVQLMHHDKKNRSTDEINCTLLTAPGDVRIDCTVNDREMEAALDIFRDLMHI